MTRRSREMSDIPDGANASVAKMTIAWEATKRCIAPPSLKGDEDEALKKLINAYLKAFRAIRDDKLIEDA